MSEPVCVAEYERLAGPAGEVAPDALRAVGGEAGARHVLELLRDEVLRGLALLGCTRPGDVGPAHIQSTVAYH